MRIAVLGGGLQGCCIALSLAARGADVTLFEQDERLMGRTAIANEGKVHLGYMYAADPSLATARMMMQGAFSFGPILARHLDVPVTSFELSRPASYVVHRQSQRTVDQVRDYLGKVHDLILEHARSGHSYFNLPFAPRLREWTPQAREREFGTDALAVFDSAEVAINPVDVGTAVRERVMADPRIEPRLGARVEKVEKSGDGFTVHAAGERHGFDQVVNALWAGRLQIDSGLGLLPSRRWIYRQKYGVSFVLPAGARVPPSATFISGPFGEVVSYPEGRTYLTWYPECVKGISTDVSPPDWPNFPPPEMSDAIARSTTAAMGDLVHAVGELDFAMLGDLHVKGGVILAWGETDIYDRRSELHRRFEIGVTSEGGYHSVDPGKLTMAPYFGDVCAARIMDAR